MRILNYRERIIELIGNVEIEDTAFVAKARYGKFFENKEIAMLEDSAKVLGKNWSIKCQKITCNLKKNIIEFMENVEIEDTLYIIKTQKLVYYKNKAETDQHIEVFRKTDSIKIEGDSGIYFLNKKEGWAYGKSKILKEKKFEILAHSILFTQNFTKGYHNVEIIKDTNIITGDSFIYINDTLKVFGKKSQISAGRKIGKGREIWLILKEDTLKKIVLKGEAESVWEDEKGKVFIQAKEIEFIKGRVYAGGGVEGKWMEKIESKKTRENLRKKKSGG